MMSTHAPVAGTSRRQIRWKALWRVGAAVAAEHVETVDEAPFVGHRLQERLFVELAPEPAQRPGGFALHHAEELEVQSRRVGSVEDRDRCFQSHPLEAGVEDEERAPGITP